jgi:preprotein translocase subunit SecA
MEAEIVAEAGAPGAVTIATNMAGRGTDIKLGGNLEMRLKKELADIEDAGVRAAREGEIRDQIGAAHETVKKAGGLFVIGTERHESRRIDNQLRGRSGRQGDPGRSRFFLSLEDDLMRIFGSDRMGGLLQRLGLKPGEAIVHPWINKALEKAQKKVEARNFDTRKNVLKYDDVMNDQRKEVYAQRKEFMRATDVSETVGEMRGEMTAAMVARRIPEKAFAEQWELKELSEDCRRLLNLDLPVEDWGREEGIDETQIRDRIEQAAEQFMAAKAANMTPELMRFIEKSLLIQTLDAVWKEHLYALDHMRQGIGLRAYGQKDPLREYQAEAFALFNAMLDELKERVTSMLGRVELAPDRPPEPAPVVQRYTELHPEPAPAYGGDGDADVATLPPPTMALSSQPMRAEAVDPSDPATWQNTPRNAPCPCGSGKKYKHCHGRLA